MNFLLKTSAATIVSLISLSALAGAPASADVVRGQVVAPGGAIHHNRVTELEYPSHERMTKVAGRSVSACVKYTFNEMYGRAARLILAYRHQKRTTRDRCQDRHCGTSPGIQVFVKNSNQPGSPWSNISVPPATRSFQRAVVFPEQRFNKVLVCRAGGGHARDNIALRNIRAFRINEVSGSN